MTSELICYCFGYTAADIERDVREHQGDSTILRQILAAKQAGGCDCKNKNPRGT